MCDFWAKIERRLFYLQTVEKQSKEKNMKKISPKWIIIVAVVLVVVIIATLLFAFIKKDNTVSKIATATVDRGEIEVIISGTGTVEPNDSYQVTSLVRGEIINAPFEEGTVVQKGDLLYQIDPSDVENSIERSKLSLERSQNTYNNNLKDMEKLTVRTEVGGTITEMYVKEGDHVAANGKIADIIDSRKMLLSIPFVSEHAQQIVPGEAAEVTLLSDGSVLFGTVSRISSGELISESGVMVKTVEIEVPNPGVLKEGDTATAMVGDISCNDYGTFSYNNTTTVTAQVSGKVETVCGKKGDFLHAGDILVILSSTALEDTHKNNSLSLREAELSLENQYDQLDNYNITSPINGTVIQKTSKQGDTLDNTNSTTVMATIADLSKILFEMSVDELDISKIQVGQSVNITADALEDRVFSGYVENVSIVGTSSNGVTTYPVTIVINDPEGLIPGMNVSADIIVEKKENVVRIPASALKRGNMVAVKLKDGEKAPEMQLPLGEETKKDSKMMPNFAPEGFRMVPVKIGLSNEDYVEILEGVSEGDIVEITTAQISMTNQFPGMGTMPAGGMSGGGMSAGGMSGGGMSGGGMPHGMSGGGMPGSR